MAFAKRERRLIRELFSLRIRPKYTTDFGEIAAIVAVPFNRYTEGNSPDYTNLDIALIAKSWLQFGWQFFGQWEQTNILQKEFPAELVHQFPGSEGKAEHVMTHTLAKWIAVEVLRLNRSNVVVLLGHPDHVYRVAALLRYYGLDPRIDGRCKSIRYDPRRRPDYQKWCTSWFRYVCLWELPLARPKLILDALRGKLR